MAKFESTSLRNVAIIGHGGTGKTTLCESFLYVSGKTDRLGRVDDGSSCMDYEPEEQRRHISISAALNSVEWKKNKINFIDTPGDSNFAFDTQSCLRVVDAAVVVLDGVGGVEFQTQKTWEYADAFKLPRIVVVSRLDRERADYAAALASVAAKMKRKVTPLYLPIGKEDGFNGLVDLVAMKAFSFEDPKGAPKGIDIPADLAAEAKGLRDTLVEDIAETDETLMEKYLDAGELSDEDIRSGLRKAVSTGNLIPAIGTAKLIGVAALLDMMADLLPSPLDRAAAKGTKLDGSSEETRLPEESAPFSALVFKTIADPYAGRLTLFRVYSGTLTADTPVYNATRKTTERFGAVFYLEGKTQKQTDKLVPGDIAAVAKLKETGTGDTLCPEKAPILYAPVQPPPAIMSFAIEPKSRGDEEKITTALHRLLEEDPTLRFTRNDETHEMILSGMGQIHIEVAVDKMKRKFGVDVLLKTPKVPYKETIKGKTNVQGRYKKQSGGRGQYGDCWLDIEPLPRGSGFEFVDRIIGGVIPQQYRPAVEKGIVEAMESGIIAGYPVVDIKVSLVDGSYHTVDSSEMAFKIAGSMGFKKGLEACLPTLLEPIVNIFVEIPEEYLGDVIGDLNSRRGKVLGMDSNGTLQIIKGQVPLAEILKYAPDLRSMTSGRGTFTYEVSHYEEVPPFVAEKVKAEAKREEEAAEKAHHH